jgi:ABC-2 type transport system permease protein
MRAVSEEYRSGAIESLMTTPLSETELVLGKYFASFIFYAIMVVATLPYLGLMAAFGAPDLGASLTAYVGLLLLGAAFVAVGVFASSLTPNQIVAWVLAAVPLLVFVWFSQIIAARAEGVWRDVFRTLNIFQHMDRYGRGLIDLESVVFFLAVAAYFVFLSVKVVESRRWR